MRSDEEFIAYVWEKYRLRQKKSGEKTSEIARAETAEYQYQQTNKPPHRRWIGWSAAAGLVVLTAAVIGGMLFGPRIWMMTKPGENSGAPSFVDSSVYTAWDGEEKGYGMWYRRVLCGDYRPEGDCRATVIAEPEELTAHLQAVDDQVGKAGWKISSDCHSGWSVQEDLSLLLSRSPWHGKTKDIFDQAFFQEHDLLVIEYSSAWVFPFYPTYTLSWNREEGRLLIDAQQKFQTEQTAYYQLFILLPKGRMTAPEKFSVEIDGVSALVRKVKTGFLSSGKIFDPDKAEDIQPYLLDSHQELVQLLEQWRQQPAGSLDLDIEDKIADWRERYSEEFFEEYDLVLFSLTEGSSSIYHQVDVRDPVRPVIGRYVKQAGTDGNGKPIGYMLADLAGYAFFVEVPKGVLTSAEEIQIEVSKEIIIAEIG